MIDLLKRLNEIGLWDIISTAVLVFAAKKYLFPKRRIPNLNFNITKSREENDHYPSKINLEIRNLTGQSMHISSMIVVLSDPFRAQQGSPGHSPTGEIELQFHGANDNDPPRRDCYLRDRESIKVWFALEPTIPDQMIDEALTKGSIGVFKAICTWIGENPTRDRIEFPIRR